MIKKEIEKSLKLIAENVERFDWNAFSDYKNENEYDWKNIKDYSERENYLQTRMFVEEKLKRSDDLTLALQDGFRKYCNQRWVQYDWIIKVVSRLLSKVNSYQELNELVNSESEGTIGMKGNRLNH